MAIIVAAEDPIPRSEGISLSIVNLKDCFCLFNKLSI